MEKMYSGIKPFLAVVLFASFMGCATTVETTMVKEWEKERAFNEPENQMLTQMEMTDDGSAITLVSPGGVQSVNVNGETVQQADRQKFFSIHVETSRGVEELTDKVSYIYVPHRHALLEFNYATFAETVTLIELENKEVKWVSKDLKWSLERYQVFARALSKGMGLGGQLATGAAAQTMLPSRFVGNLTEIIPELDALIFKTLDGLSLIDLSSGEVVWTNKNLDGGLAEVIFDEESNSIVVVNSDDEAFSIEGLQFNKQIMRIDAETGDTVWEGNYDGNIREKVDGFGIWADRRADIRLVDGKIMINFLNVEVYDFETGEQLWQTTTGNDKLLDYVAPEAQIMNLFAFPVIHDDMLYRVTHENTGLTGVDVVVEAYNYQTGDLMWKSGKLSRSEPVNDMLVAGDKLVVSIGASEGITAFDLKTGEKKWENSGFGKNGIQFEMIEHNGNVIAAGSGKMYLINADSGEELFAINTANDGLGDMKDIAVRDNSLLITGSNGFGIYNPENGELISSVATPTGGIMSFNEQNDRVLISPKPNYADAKYPADAAVYLIDSEEVRLLGTLGTDKNRKKWKISPDFSNIYVLTNNTISMYSTN